MTLFLKTLFIVHLFSMCLGIGLGIATAFAGAQITDVKSEAGRATLGLMKKYGGIGRVAILLLWITGIAMVLFSYPDPLALGWTFYAKIVAVIVLTGSVLKAGTLGPKIAGGDVDARALGKKLGMLNGLAAFIALVLAVLTFSL